MKPLVLLAILCSILQSAAQGTNDQLIREAEKLNRRGDFNGALDLLSGIENTPEVELLRIGIIWKKGEPAESLEGINKFISGASAAELQIDAKLLKTKILFSYGDPLASIALIDSLFQFLEDPRDISEAYNTKAKGLIWAGEAAKAVSVNNKSDSVFSAHKLEDPLLQGNIFNVDGILAYFNGDFDGAIRNFELAINAKKKALETTHIDIISLYGNTGVMYKNKLEFDKALQYYKYELENYAKSIGEDHLLVATSYQNIGGIYHSKAEYDMALKAMQVALRIRREKLGENNPLTLDIYEWIGNIHAAKGEYELAGSLFTKVLKGRIDLLGAESHFVSLAYYNLGETYFSVGEYEAALFNFQKAADIGDLIYESENHDQASNINGIAMSLDKLGKHSEARKSYFHAIEKSFPGYTWNGDPTIPPSITNYLRFDEIFTSLVGLATSFQHSGDLKDQITALRFVKTAKELLDAHKRNFTNKSDKITIAKSAKRLADIALEINYKLFQENEDVEYLSSIFQWNEYVKGTTLLSTISDQQARQVSGIPDSLLQKEHRFRVQKDSVKTLLSEAKGETSGSNLTTFLFELEKKHEALVLHFEKEYPRYSEVKYGLKPFPVDSIIASISHSGEAIIQYFVTTENRIFTSIVTQGGHNVVTSECNHLNNHILDFREALDKIDDQGFEQSSKQLYSCVFKPVLPHIRETDQVTIITDGALGYIPFELLMDENGRYLLEKYHIKYDLSSSLLTQRTRKKNSTEKLLAYAPKFENNGESQSTVLSLVRSSSLEDLPGAVEEVKGIQNTMSGELRIGTSATESSFKSEAGEFDILHLATHSIINQRDPSYTKLMFSPDDGEDGQLHIYELENLSLSASLVTLSACNTGIGKIAEGEGVMSLARSFRSVGVPSVVMSLWPASDKSTPELMKYFYQNLKDGQSKDLALNNARKQYLEIATGKARHPFYWGGFVLIGDNQPIAGSSNSSIWLLPIGVVVVIVISVARKRRRTS